MPDRGRYKQRDRQAELRAERIAWRERSRSMNRAFRSLNERLRKMNGWAAALDRRLGHHAEAGRLWHLRWDDPARSG